jgi:uncharacterized protein YbaP (TraB family)
MVKFLSSSFAKIAVFYFAAALIPERLVAQTPEEPIGGLLWKISGNGLKQPSYVFGTASAVCPPQMELSRPVLRTLQEAAQLVLTLNITDPTLSAQVMQEMQLPPGQNISQWFTPGEYAKVERFYTDSLQLSLQDVARFQPLYVSSFLFAWVLNCPAISYEQELARQAGMQNKAIFGLETVAQQGQMFRQIPYRNQAKLLVEALTDPNELKAFYTDMVVSYRNQDLPSLYTIGKELSLGTTAYEDVLLRDRSRRWIPQIEGFIQDKPTFIAVNATHLPGTDGLLAMLRRRGYIVEMELY